MANKFKSKFKKGQKFKIEIAEVHTHYNDEGKPYSVYRIKGFNSLFLDNYALGILEQQMKEGETKNESC